VVRRWTGGGVAIITIAAAGCDVVGACDHAYLDPVVRIERVSGTDGAELREISVFDVTVDGLPQDLTRLAAPPARGVRLLDGQLICQVGCGFGIAEGQWEFTTRAPGFADRRVTVDARYAAFGGGCPSHSTGGTTASIALVRPAPAPTD
jgi:hypothetical protein